MTYSYPGLGGKPVLIVCVECLLTGRAFFVNMLVDGLIGMDIIHEWKGVSFEPNKHGVMIRISV